MSLTLYMHPLASYCQKVLIALYENGTPFAPRIVDLGDEKQRAALLKLWPIGKFPVLRDDARDQTVVESTIIIEYLAQYYPGKAQLVPTDGDLAWQTRLRDRFYDLHVHEHMQKIVGDRLRASDAKDPHGVAQARASLQTAYAMIEAQMVTNTWAMGETFSMADCSAAPALFYANLVLPFEQTHPHVARYFARLMARPSFARVVEEARPYFSSFPQQ
jgi:glutathione S-transferase